MLIFVGKYISFISKQKCKLITVQERQEDHKSISILPGVDLQKTMINLLPTILNCKNARILEVSKETPFNFNLQNVDTGMSSMGLESNSDS